MSGSYAENIKLIYRDNECKPGLVCGSDNCRKYHPTAEKTSDCCTTKLCNGQATDWSCCTSSEQCGLGGGDCDKWVLSL